MSIRSSSLCFLLTSLIRNPVFRITKILCKSSRAPLIFRWFQHFFALPSLENRYTFVSNSSSSDMNYIFFRSRGLIRAESISYSKYSFMGTPNRKNKLVKSLEIANENVYYRTGNSIFAQKQSAVLKSNQFSKIEYLHFN